MSIVDITLSQLGETMEDAEVIAWHKDIGQPFQRGEVLLEVQTDKIVAEIPSLFDGVLLEITAQPGSTVRVGQLLGRAQGSGSGKETQPTAGSAATESPPSSIIGQPEPHSDRVRASPSARRLARELQVELCTVKGTGRHGRVTGDDVRLAAQASQTEVSAPAAATTPPPKSHDLHPLTRTEIAVGRITSRSKRHVPHFYVRSRADVTRFMQLLEIERREGRNFSVNDAVVRAAALALREHPRLNAVLDGEHLRLLTHVHVGVITATPGGLVTSVVRHADQLGLDAIHARVRDVRQRATAGRALAEDATGATFCISNLGMYDVEEFSAIILPPNVAILAVGAVQEEVIAERGAIRIARTVRLTLSADHRALDGVEAALFLRTLGGLLNRPEHILAEVKPDAVPAGH